MQKFDNSITRYVKELEKITEYTSVMEAFAFKITSLLQDSKCNLDAIKKEVQIVDMAVDVMNSKYAINLRSSSLMPMIAPRMIR